MPKNREVLMDEEKRSNQNYEIIESCTIGSTELVIGHNPNAPNPYVRLIWDMMILICLR